MLVNVCPDDIFLTTEHFVTKPGMVMQHHKPQCHAETCSGGASDTKIKVPSVENTELEGSPFKAWGRSVYGHTCYTNCQGFVPC